MSAVWDRFRRYLEAWGEVYTLPADRLTGQITGSQIAPATGSSSGAVSLSDADPADVGDAGTADPGTDGAVSRGDHVHALPATGVIADTYGDASNYPIIQVDAEGRIVAATTSPSGGGSGTVTSVGLALPSALFDITGSPVTTSGTLTATLDNQTANTVFAGPSTGSPAAPAFRALVPDDVPDLSAAKITSGVLDSNFGGTGVDNDSRTLTISGSNNVELSSSGGPHSLALVANGAAVVQAGGGIINTRVAFSNADDYLTTDADFTFIAASNELRVPLLRLAEQSTPSTPASGFGALFFSTAGLPSAVDDAGALYRMVPAATQTYTPTYLGGTTPGTTTYTVQIGRYRMLADNLCWVYGRVDWTAASGTGIVRVSLPFTARNITNMVQAFAGYIIGVTFAASGILFAVSPNDNAVVLNSPTSNGGSSLVSIETAGTIIFEGVYEVA